MKNLDFYAQVLTYIRSMHTIGRDTAKEAELKAKADSLGLPFNLDKMNKVACDLGVERVDWDSSSMSC